MNEVLKRIHAIGIVPVIALDDINHAAPLAKALCRGGLPVAEVTYRTACAHDAIVEMKKECPNMLVGAGTVLTTEQVDSAIDAGAEFIVSPGLNETIVKYCQEKNIVVLPGTSCASDIERALSLGLDTVKFFPAENLGGLKMLKALSAPYNMMKFMPTGGVNPKNFKEYLDSPFIVACGGTWMIDKKALANKDYDKIEELTSNAVKEMLDISIKHIGINVGDDAARGEACKFAHLFRGEVKETSKGYFGSSFIEIMKEDYHKGSVGHIAIGVRSTERAMAYYKALGYEFDDTSVVYDDNGDAKFAYFKDEFCGFAVHLVNL